MGAIFSALITALAPHVSSRAARARARVRERAGRGAYRLPVALALVVGVVVGALIGGVLGDGDETEPARVPDVTGMSVVKARAALESVGLEVAVSGGPEGEVISQDPSAGAKTDSGTTVELTASNGEKPGPPDGEILSPREDERVQPGQVAVEGTISALPDGRHVWIAVRIGGGLFPKEPEVAANNGQFAETIHEPGPPHRFSVVLLAVGETGQREIEQWLEDGARTGSFPPLATISGSRELDIVRNVIQAP